LAGYINELIPVDSAVYHKTDGMSLFGDMIDGTKTKIDANTTFTMHSISWYRLPDDSRFGYFYIHVYTSTTDGNVYLDFNGGDEDVNGNDVLYYTESDKISGIAPSPYCLVNSSSEKSCKSIGINLNRSAGTITFSKTPMYAKKPLATTKSGSLTITGAFTFKPF
jgi:hypothetical protein